MKYRFLAAFSIVIVLLSGCKDDPLIPVPPQSKYGDMRPNNDFPESMLNIDYIELDRLSNQGEYFIFNNRQGNPPIDALNGLMEVAGINIPYDVQRTNFELGITDTVTVRSLKALMGSTIAVRRRNFADSFAVRLFTAPEIRVTLQNRIGLNGLQVLDSALFTWQPAGLGRDSSRILVSIDQIFSQPNAQGRTFYSNRFQVLDNGLFILSPEILKELELNRTFNLEFDRVNYSESRNAENKRIGLFKNSRYRFELRTIR